MVFRKIFWVKWQSQSLKRSTILKFIRCDEFKILLLAPFLYSTFTLCIVEVVILMSGLLSCGITGSYTGTQMILAKFSKDNPGKCLAFKFGRLWKIMNL